MKRLAAAVMAVILLCALSSNALTSNALASNALAKTSSFPDVTDNNLAREVAVLQMLGVISGDENGYFVPGGSLTRAAFCKMAVITMGRGDEESLYRNRTIFPDVRTGHWARGYINLAVSGEKKIIMGNNDGTFTPDADISYAQAVTILMRMLKYTDADAGMLWPDGYLTLAGEIGLTDGLVLSSSGAAVTRAQAAHLFCNLLGTPVKDGASYISTLGTSTDGVVIMQLDVQAADGTSGAIRTSKGPFKTVNGVLPTSILGMRGTLLKNNATGKVLTFLPDMNKQVTITVDQANAGWIKDSLGIRYDIKADTPAYTSEEISTYGDTFINIATGMQVTLFYTAEGTADGIFINTSKYDAAFVVGSANAAVSFGSLTGGDTGYTINKNGAPATSSDIRQYDVLTYDRSAKILDVSDFRLTGCYESCWPNMSSPSKITAMGHEFTVLPSAIDSLAKYTVGQIITLLFTSDLQVAGAVTSGVSGSTAVGIVQSGITDANAKVKLLNGLVLAGIPELSGYSAAQLSGELVVVYSTTPGHISLSKLSGSGTAGELDLTKGTLGSAALSPAVKVFERVGSGGVALISLSDLTQSKISASKVMYTSLDYVGRVDTLILNDVTGDRYTYGILKSGVMSGGSMGGIDSVNNSVSVINSGNEAGTTPVITGAAFTNGVPGGVVVSTDGENVAAIVTLTEVKNVKRSAFYVRNGVTYLQINSVEYPVSQNVECYNSLGKSWFASLNDARAFAETLTVYYDRAAADGGKIRVVVAG